jgi:hypothetical protein
VIFCWRARRLHWYPFLGPTPAGLGGTPTNGQGVAAVERLDPILRIRKRIRRVLARHPTPDHLNI